MSASVTNDGKVQGVPTQGLSADAAQQFNKAVQEAKAAQDAKARQNAKADPLSDEAQGAGAAAMPVPTVNNAQTATITAAGDSSSPPISVQGGAWPVENVGTVTALGAAPQVAPGQLRDSAENAAKMAAGTSVETLAKAGQSPAAINGAFELMGVSDRQIGLYAEAAAKGGVGKDQQVFGTLKWTPEGTTAFDTLKSAAQVRAAVSDTGAQDIVAGTKSGAVFSPVPGLSGLPQAAGSGVPPEYTVAGVQGAVDDGVKKAGAYYFPDFVANGMLYGSGGIQINKAIPARLSAFGGSDAASAASAVAQGGDALKRTAVLGGAPAMQGADLLPQAGSAAVQLNGLAHSGADWTPNTATQAFYAADTLLQGIGPDAGRRLIASQTQLGATAQDQTTAQLAAAQRTAIDGALRDNGIDGIDAQTIGATLLSAAASPAFAQATGGSQDSANSAYRIMGSFDPQSVQRLGVVQSYTDPNAGPVNGLTQDQRGRVLQATLGEMGNANASTVTGAVPTANQKVAAGLAAGQWAAASARSFLAGTSKAAAGTSTALEPRISQYASLVQGAVQSSTTVLVPDATGGNVVSVPTTSYQYQGQTVGRTMEEVQSWAAQQSGLGSNPGFVSWLGGAGADVAKFIDRNGLAPIGATMSTALRATRLAASTLTPLSQAQAAAGIAADAMVVGEWATQPRRLGAGLNAALVNSELALVPGAAALQDTAGMVRMFDGLPPTEPSPVTPVGRFIGTVVPQIGGVSNLIYGGFNLAQGFVSFANGQNGAGAGQVLTGSIDFVNGLHQLTNAAAALNPAWENINNFGGYYTPPLQVASRFVAALGGVAVAGLAGAGG